MQIKTVYANSGILVTQYLCYICGKLCTTLPSTKCFSLCCSDCEAKKNKIMEELA